MEAVEIGVLLEAMGKDLSDLKALDLAELTFAHTIAVEYEPFGLHDSLPVKALKQVLDHSLQILQQALKLTSGSLLLLISILKIELDTRQFMLSGI